MSDATPTKDTQTKDTPSAKATFTEAETTFLLAALKHAEGGTFKFDFAAVATELGLKDAQSVRARWNTINRTKIQGNGTAGGVEKASPGKTNKKPKEVTPKKDGTPKTPKKRGRPSKADKEAAEKAAAEADANEQVDGEAEEAIKPEAEDED